MNVIKYVVDKKMIIPIGNEDGLTEDEVIARVKQIEKVCQRKKLTLEFENSTSYTLEILKRIVNANDLSNKLDIIYDYICEYLDNDIKKNNYCDFVDEECIVNRIDPKNYIVNGCCTHSSRGTCRFLIKGKCANQNSSCKIFMCSYIVKTRKIKYKINDIPLVKHFLNYEQKLILQYSYFKSKEEIIKKLLRAHKIRSVIPSYFYGR